MRKEYEAWLDDAPLVTEPDPEQMAQIRLILGSEGLRLLWGMQLALAQGKRVQLENSPPGTPERDVALATIQGGIKGIYTLRDTLLELVPMGDEPAAPEEERV